MTEKPVVLWISRHAPLDAQLTSLENKIGRYELVIYGNGVRNDDHVVEMVKFHNADYVVAILPLSFIMRLAEKAEENGFVLLYSVMKQLHSCTNLPCPEFIKGTDSIAEPGSRHYRFIEFKKIKEVKIVLEDWK